MSGPLDDDDDLVYMLRHSHLSPTSLRDLEREIADRLLLQNARRQHQLVQDAAVTASTNYLLSEEQRNLEELSKQERRRVKLAEQRIKEQAELERSKAVPTPTPPPPSPAPPVKEVPKNSYVSAGTQTLPIDASIPPPPSAQPPPLPPPPATQPPPPVRAPEKPNPIAAPSQPIHSHTSIPKQVGLASVQPPQTSHIISPDGPQPVQRSKISTSHISPDADQYLQIHQELKRLRKYVIEVGNQNSKFRSNAGELRRALRTKIGQIKAIKGVPGANKEQITAIMAILKNARELPGPMCDPSSLFVRPPPPVQGEPDQLPLLFIYIMNIFTKVIINQFISEASIKPAAADPIGTVAVNILARHCWRGASLIDMLIAKFRVTCPVLFGFRGNEKTEQGRERLGWWKANGEWVSENVHFDRMTGLSAGFAAISLRDFSRVTSMKNPFPPPKYWSAMAAIINTPAAEVSSTQYVVLKGMIDGYEKRFLLFYGSAARAALKLALVDFPSRAREPDSAATSLGFLASTLQDELGVNFG